MAVITIPFDYNERTHPTIVPICIADTDAEGNAVHRGWIDLGVEPVVDRFFKIAERLLADKFRASEIAEYAVHSLSRTHGDNIGDRPTVKVLNSARLYAVDQRAGGRPPASLSWRWGCFLRYVRDGSRHSAPRMPNS